MSFELNSQSGRYVRAVYDFYCDQTSDLAQINKSECPMGTTAYIIDPAVGEPKLYMLNSSKQWIAQG